MPARACARTGGGERRTVLLGLVVREEPDHRAFGRHTRQGGVDHGVALAAVALQHLLTTGGQDETEATVAESCGNRREGRHPVEHADELEAVDDAQDQRHQQARRERADQGRPEGDLGAALTDVELPLEHDGAERPDAGGDQADGADERQPLDVGVDGVDGPGRVQVLLVLGDRPRRAADESGGDDEVDERHLPGRLVGREHLAAELGTGEAAKKVHDILRCDGSGRIASYVIL